MDQELIAYLDERFRETFQQIASLREETSRNFEQISGRFGQMDGRLDQVDSRLDQVDSRLDQVDSRLDQMDSHLERVETAIRHTQVEVEGLRSDIQLLAEGQMSTAEKLGSFRDEAAKEFEETRSSIKVPYMGLDGRVKSLEAWRERRDQTDPMDLIRERYGKRP